MIPIRVTVICVVMTPALVILDNKMTCFSSFLQNETFLCHRFTKFVMKYNLMSKDNLIVPILEEEVQNSVSGESEA